MNALFRSQTVEGCRVMVSGRQANTRHRPNAGPSSTTLDQQWANAPCLLGAHHCPMASSQLYWPIMLLECIYHTGPIQSPIHLSHLYWDFTMTGSDNPPTALSVCTLCVLLLSVYTGLFVRYNGDRRLRYHTIPHRL